MGSSLKKDNSILPKNTLLDRIPNDVKQYYIHDHIAYLATLLPLDKDDVIAFSKISGSITIMCIANGNWYTHTYTLDNENKDRVDGIVKLTRTNSTVHMNRAIIEGSYEAESKLSLNFIIEKPNYFLIALHSIKPNSSPRCLLFDVKSMLRIYEHRLERIRLPNFHDFAEKMTELYRNKVKSQIDPSLYEVYIAL